jgi:putative spermidine/putrescine transport system ATP-binding protein
MRRASASLCRSSLAHQERAAAPHSLSRPPPVELATTTLTQPEREAGAPDERAIAHAASAATTTSEIAISRRCRRVSGWDSRWAWPIITMAAQYRVGPAPAQRSAPWFPNMDVRTNVAFGLRMRRQAKATRLRRADELLELVGLGDTADRYPHQLSGGQQQRVAIARALAIEPKVLLLDEPLSALDARVRTQLRGEIRRLQQRLGITTLFVTHDQSEALSIADRVGVMQSGRLEQIDTPENVYRHPATAFVADFVGAMNRLPGRIGDGPEVQVLGQRLEVLNPDGRRPGDAVDALLRPEAIAIVPDPAGPGEIIERTFFGSSVRLTVALDAGHTVLVESHSHDAGAELGARVGLRILAASVTVTEPTTAP